MVGAVGGGGLGDLGIRYGYQRFMPEMMLAVVVVLIALVQTCAERRRLFRDAGSTAGCGIADPATHQTKADETLFNSSEYCSYGQPLRLAALLCDHAIGRGPRRNHPRRRHRRSPCRDHRRREEGRPPNADSTSRWSSSPTMSFRTRRLALKDLEANSFQHEPYLKNQISKTGWKIVKVANTIGSPQGVYSQKYKKLAGLAGRRAGRDRQRSLQRRARADDPCASRRYQAEGPEQRRLDHCRYHRQPEEAALHRARRG